MHFLEKSAQKVRKKCAKSAQKGFLEKSISKN
jgi:hypothetical protein